MKMWLAVALLVSTASPALADDLKKTAQSAPDAPATRHGIIRRPQPKPAETSKPAPAPPEAAATPIAHAVQSAKPAAESARAKPAAPAPPRVPPRRYVVTWPHERIELRWAVEDERVRLSWEP